MTGFPAQGDNFRVLDEHECHEITLKAYRAAIRGALERGDRAKALELQNALRDIERRPAQ